MKGVTGLVPCLLLLGTPALADKPGCPIFEAGARYPWQSNEILPGDRFAWVILDIDRDGVPFRCRVGNNNYIENETRFFLCKNYSDRWRGPRAAESDPDRRTLERFSLIAGYEHDMADRKARRLWFKQHPEERPECYPEPTRPDRLD